MRNFIDILNENEADGTIDIHEQAHDLAMSAIYAAKANKHIHGHADVFWLVDLNDDLQPNDMVKVMDLMAMGQIAIKSAKNWLHRAAAITILPFHDPLSERHVIEKLTNAIVLKNTPAVEESVAEGRVDEKCDVDEACGDKEACEEGDKTCNEGVSIREKLEKALKENEFGSYEAPIVPEDRLREILASATDASVSHDLDQ